MEDGPPTFFLVSSEKVIGQYPVVHHTGVFSIAKAKETFLSIVTCLFPLLENQYECQ